MTSMQSGSMGGSMSGSMGGSIGSIGGSMGGSIGGAGAPAPSSPTSEERPGLPDLPTSGSSPQPRRDSQGKSRRYSLQPQRNVIY